MFMHAREGDLIKTTENIIFDVKGQIHPPNKIIAFPRYIPSKAGNRGQGSNLYSKVYNLAERFQYLKNKAPQLIVEDPVFGDTLCEVPVNTIIKRYDPIAKLQELRQASELHELEYKVVQLAETLKEEANIPWSCMGISGSVMAGLFTLQSDIDPLIYGIENSQKAYAALKSLLQDEKAHFKPYTYQELNTLFGFRSKDTIMSFEDFAHVESRKAFQGMYQGVDFFIRFVKDWNEVTETYGDVYYENAGYSKLTALVTDDKEALFTPCKYKIENVQVLEGTKLQHILEVVSFRGRFCEQAKAGEKVVVQGKVEKVINKKQGRQYYRVIIGNKPSDFMALQ
jgi:predicted nucleotidyltransferase